MGYYTDYYGKLMINKPLTAEDKETLSYIMKVEHNNDNSIVPRGWNSWDYRERHGEEWLHIEENGKHYYEEQWLNFLISQFFKPKGYLLNGNIVWIGEDGWDLGAMRVKDNVVERTSIGNYSEDEIIELLFSEKERRNKK